MQKSLAKNSIYNIIYTVANILFPFATSIYVSRILLPVGVGKVASAQNIASYFITVAALGLPSYGVREFAKIREKKDKRNNAILLYPDYEYIVGYYAWDGVIYKKDETD